MGVSYKRYDPWVAQENLRRQLRKRLEQDTMAALYNNGGTSGTATYTGTTWEQTSISMEDALRMQSGFWERICSQHTGRVDWMLNRRKVQERLHQLSSRELDVLMHDRHRFDKHFGPGAWSQARGRLSDPRVDPRSNPYRSDSLDAMRWGMETYVNDSGPKPKRPAIRKPLAKPFKRDKSRTLAQQLEDDFYDWVGVIRMNGQPSWPWKKDLPRAQDVLS